MRTRIAGTLWWQLTPVQRAMMKRVARQGSLDRMLPWEGRTIRSLAARGLLKRAARQEDGQDGWSLTERARLLLAQADERVRADAAAE